MKKLNYYISALLGKIFIWSLKFSKNKLYHDSQKTNQKRFCFILSPGRSGSTFLRKELVRLGVGIPPESYDFIPNLVRWFSYNRFSNWSKLVDKSIDIFKESAPNEHWRLDFNELKKSSRQVPKEHQTLCGCIFLFYQSFVQKHYGSTLFMGDKTPLLSLHLDVLRIVFPFSKYISIIRQSEKVILSRSNKLGEPLKVSRNRYIWFLNSLKRHKNKVNAFPEITLENFSHYKEACLTYILKKINFEPSRITLKSTVFLGDDEQTHHSEIHKKIVKHKIDKDTLTELDSYFLYIYQLEKNTYAQ